MCVKLQLLLLLVSSRVAQCNQQRAATLLCLGVRFFFFYHPQILVRTMLRKRSFGNPFDASRREERGATSATHM